MKYLHKIEYYKITANTDMLMVALFDPTEINKEDVIKLIESDEVEQNDLIITLPKNKYNELKINDSFYDDLRMEQQEQM